jgi:ribosomal protein S18 acetylase RimI-like enzyme
MAKPFGNMPSAICFNQMNQTFTPHFALATLADLDALVELNALAFEGDERQNGKGPASYKNPPWHQNALTHHHYFKMLLGQDLVGGMVVVDKEEGHYFLDTIFIGPAYQDLGLGQKAMRFLEHAFPQAKRWSLVTPHKSYRNHHLYEKLGYQKTGEKFLGDQPGMAEDFTLFFYEKLL